MRGFTIFAAVILLVGAVLAVLPFDGERVGHEADLLENVGWWGLLFPRTSERIASVKSDSSGQVRFLVVDLIRSLWRAK